MQTHKQYTIENHNNYFFAGTFLKIFFYICIEFFPTVWNI